MIRISKFVKINIAVYILFVLNPYFKWVVSNDIIYAYFSITFLFTTIYLLKNSKNFCPLSKNKLLVFLILLLFLVFFTTPVIHYWRWGHLIWFLPFVQILLYKYDLVLESYNYFKKIIIIVSVFSLVIWIVKLVNIPLPYYGLYPDFRYNPSDYYRVYGLSISLYRGSRAIGEIFGIERITGIFAEPGHFGIYLGLILAIERFSFTSKANRILLFTGILTFSTAFYGILLAGYIYRLFTERSIYKGVMYPITAIIFLFGSAYLIFGPAIINLILGDLLSDGRFVGVNPLSIIDARISKNFITDFQQFITTSHVWIGLGYSDLDIATTNWRGLIFRFGFLGIFLILLLTTSLLVKVKFSFFLVLFSVVLMILAHRSYLLYTPGIYLLIYIASIFPEGIQKSNIKL